MLELKIGPHEGENDRLIGQCCKYSVEWMTWAVVIDMNEGKCEELVALLAKKSFHHIEVIPFDSDEEDEEDDEDEENEDYGGDDDDNEKIRVRLSRLRFVLRKILKMSYIHYIVVISSCCK